MRGTGDVEGDIGIGVAIAVALGAVGVHGGTDQEVHIRGGVVEQYGAVGGMDIGFHGSLRGQGDDRMRYTVTLFDHGNENQLQ